VHKITNNPTNYSQRWRPYQYFQHDQVPRGFDAPLAVKLSTAMVIFQFEEVAAKLIFHPRRQANLPVWR
jgi:hypothetical protein